MKQDLSKKIKLLIKSEKALFAIEVRRRSKQLIWVIIGILSLLATFIMLNITLYFYLSSNFDTVTSTAILTIMNIGFSSISFFIASSKRKSKEADSIEEIRDYALEQLANDIDETKNSIEEFKDSLLKAKDNIFGFKSLIPLITTIIDLSKKGKKDAS